MQKDKNMSSSLGGSFFLKFRIRFFHHFTIFMVLKRPNKLIKENVESEISNHCERGHRLDAP
jgi:hypothetical protein